MTSLARNVARNAASVSTFSAFFFLGLHCRASGLKVVRSVLRSLARNVARNVSRNAASVSTLSAFFFLGLVFQVSCLTVRGASSETTH